jgi:hypothetical protein
MLETSHINSEIYPSVRDSLPDEIKDRGQVRCALWKRAWICCDFPRRDSSSVQATGVCCQRAVEHRALSFKALPRLSLNCSSTAVIETPRSFLKTIAHNLELAANIDHMRDDTSNATPKPCPPQALFMIDRVLPTTRRLVRKSSLQPPWRAERQVHKDQSSSGPTLRGSAGGAKGDKHLPSMASNFSRSVRERD